VLGRDRTVVYATTEVEARLAAWFGGRWSALPCELETWLRNGAAERPLTLDRDGSRLVVSLVLGPAGSEALVLTERRATPEIASLMTMGLSRREAQVLALASDGGTNAQIARHLMLSPRTVKKHLESIYDKLGVRTRTGAVALALRAM